MKAKIVLIILITLISCKKDIQEKDNIKENKQTTLNHNTVQTDEGIAFLKNFYTKYYCNDEQLFRNSDRTDYLSTELINKMEKLSDPENLELDYDPFIKAQDFYAENIKKTIEFSKNTAGFIVTFINFKEEGQTRLEFELIKNKQGKIKINNILNDSLLVSVK